jgi:hypothetical protein
MVSDLSGQLNKICGFHKSLKFRFLIHTVTIFSWVVNTMNVQLLIPLWTKSRPSLPGIIFWLCTVQVLEAGGCSFPGWVCWISHEFSTPRVIPEPCCAVSIIWELYNTMDCSGCIVPARCWLGIMRLTQWVFVSLVIRLLDCSGVELSVIRAYCFNLHVVNFQACPCGIICLLHTYDHWFGYRGY